MCKCCSSEGWVTEQADDSNCVDVAVLQGEIEGCELAREWGQMKDNSLQLVQCLSCLDLLQSSPKQVQITQDKLEQLDAFQHYTQNGNFNFLQLAQQDRRQTSLISFKRDSTLPLTDARAPVTPTELTYGSELQIVSSKF